MRLAGPLPTPPSGYVSHGCVRMARQDVIDLYYLVDTHPAMPVTIQREPELDAAGALVDIGTTPALFPAGAPIPYGPSVGPRPF